MGNVYRDLNQPDEAVKAHQEVLALFKDVGNPPGQFTTLYLLALDYLSLQQLEKALLSYQAAAEMDNRPGTATDQLLFIKRRLAYSYFVRGLTFAQQNDYEQATADFSQVIALQLNEANAYNNRAACYLRKGDCDRAIDDANQALSLKSDLANAYFVRGQAYAAKGQHTEAIADFNEFHHLQGRGEQSKVPEESPTPSDAP